jgi:3-oxoadipate CoA-transferase alpha subunit
MGKVYKSSLQAIAAIPDGTSIMFGGFGRAGLPVSLIYTLKQYGAKRLTAGVHDMRLHV